MFAFFYSYYIFFLCVHGKVHDLRWYFVYTRLDVCLVVQFTRAISWMFPSCVYIICLFRGKYRSQNCFKSPSRDAHRHNLHQNHSLAHIQTSHLIELLAFMYAIFVFHACVYFVRYLSLYCCVEFFFAARKYDGDFSASRSIRCGFSW